MDIFEKNAWNDAWNKVLNRLGIRKVPGGTVNYLGNVLENLETSVALAGSTTADMTLYVDSAAGVDTNTGLVGFPLKTIQAAIDKIPLTIKHNVTINVAGTFTEHVTAHFRVDKWVSVTIIGAPSTIMTGVTASGALVPVSGHTFQVVGAGWVAHALKGKFIKVNLFGTDMLYPIWDNAADSVTISPLCGASYPNVDNKAFELHELHTVWNSSGGNYDCIVLGGVDDATNQNGLTFKHILFNNTHNYYPIQIGDGTTVYECSIVNSKMYSSSVITARNSQASLDKCYCLASGEGSCSLQAAESFLIIDSCVFDASGVDSYWCDVYNDNYLYISNGVATGKADCMCIGQHRNTVVFANFAINTVTGNGIAVYNSANNTVRLEAGCSITNCTVKGIKLSHNWKSGQNMAHIASSVAMSGNGGDLTLDGTASILLADLRADPDKTVVDLIRLNRIVAE